MRKLTGKQLIVIAFIIAGFVLRLIYLLQYSASPLFNNVSGPDVEEYNHWANVIMQGNLLWKTVSIHSPLYPYFLALLKFFSGSDFFYVRLLQLTVGMLGLFILYKAIENIKFENRITCRILSIGFLILSMLFIPLYFYQGEIISEALLIPLVAISIALLYKAETLSDSKSLVYYLLSGFVLGLAIITHPISIFFAFSEIVYLTISYIYAFTKNKVGKFPLSLVMFVVPVLIIVISISAYNTQINNSFVFIQRNSGFNLYLGNNPNANGMCNVIAGPEWVKVHGEADKAAETAGITKNEYFLREVCNYVTHNPLEWLRLIGTKAMMVWNYKDFYSGMDLIAVKYFTPVMRYGKNFFGILAVFAMFGIFSSFRKPRMIFKLRHFLILLFSIWGGLTLTVVSDRYRFVILLSFFVLAPFGVSVLLSEIRKFKSAIFNVLFLMLAVLIVYFPIYHINIQKDKAFALAMYGEAYYKAGEYPLAKKYLHNALLTFPEWDRCYNDLGLMEMHKNPMQALKLFETAHRLVPSNPSPVVNIGIIYSMIGKERKALKYYTKAFALDNSDAEIIYSYANSLYKLNNLNKALKVLNYAERQRCISSKIRNLTGIIFLKQNKPEKALGPFKMAVQYQPDNYDYKLNLAVCLIAVNNKNKALDIVNQVLKKYPENKAALQIKKNLID